MPTILVHPGACDNKGELNEISIGRLERGLSVYDGLLKKGIPREEIYFVSSVKDKGRNGKSQSELMKEAIVKIKGIPERIITSNESHNTWEDIRNSFRLVAAKKLPQPVINVSSSDHITPRIRLMAWFWGRSLHVEVAFVSSSRMRFKDSMLEPVKILKAIFLIVKTFLRGEFA